MSVPPTPAPPHAASGWLLVLAPLLVVALLLALETTNVDRIVESRYFDPASGTFPLRHDWFLEVVLHYWTKLLVALVALVAFAGFLLSFVLRPLAPGRRTYLFVAAAIAASTLTVSALKLVSYRHCPWDFADYGGVVPYTRLLEPTPPSVRPGNCFPAGHASTGFALLAFYFVGRVRGDRRLARAGLALGLVAGLGLGYGRMLQGAHFASHVLWSGVVCWFVILAVYLACFGRSAGTPPPGTGREKRVT